MGFWRRANTFFTAYTYVRPLMLTVSVAAARTDVVPEAMFRISASLAHPDCAHVSMLHSEPRVSDPTPCSPSHGSLEVRPRTTRTPEPAATA